MSNHTSTMAPAAAGPQTITEMPDLEKVHSLIKTMYQQRELKETASKWLEELQKSVYAWHIADQLLIKRLDFESCYFAAQTLKTKIQYNFNELPPTSYGELKDSIINHLVNIDEKVIQTQLCLSLTFIFFNNPNWTNPMEELSVKLSESKFLEILICIAQEYDENRTAVKMSKQRRDDIQEYLSKHFASVIELLMTTLQKSRTLDTFFQEQVAIKFFSCFDAWFIFATKENIKQIEPVLNTIFAYLRNQSCPSDVHEKVSDALCKVIYQCEGHSTFSDLRVVVLNEILKLESAYTDAVVAEDSEKLIDFARIFTELGNSVIEFIIHDQIDMQILNLILKCVGHFEFEVAATTFGFWYNFSELVFKNGTTRFNPILNILLTSLTRHCQLEPDFEDIVDEKSDQYEYRLQISELVREIVPCCDWVEFIKSSNLVGILKTATNWVDIEVNLYIVYCIACDKNFIFQNEHKNDVLPDIVNFILQLSNQPTSPHIQVLATSCDLLAELTEWINDNSAYLNPVISFLLTIITSSYKTCPKLATRACLSLKQIITGIKSVDLNAIKNLFVSLENVYIQIEDISVDLSVSLMACFTAIVSNQNFSKCDEQEFFVERIIQLCLNKVNEIMNHKISAEVNQKRWEKIIDNIYAIFKDFVPNQKTLQSESIHGLILNQIWPFLKMSITHFCSIDSQVIEHCSRVVRHIVRSMKPAYLLQPIVDHIVPLYQQYPTNSPLLYIGSVLVSEFGNENDPSLANGLIIMLNAFSISTFLLLNEANLNLYPYTIADFFTLCSRMLTHLTENFVSNSETLNNILNLTIMALYLDQKEANDSVIHFICDLIKTEHPIVDQYIKGSFGQKLFYTLIDSIMFKLPGYFIPDMVNAIWDFRVTEPACFAQYLQFSVNELSTKIQGGQYTVTNENLQNFYESIASASNPKRLVSELRYLQRLFN